MNISNPWVCSPSSNFSAVINFQSQIRKKKKSVHKYHFGIRELGFPKSCKNITQNGTKNSFFSASKPGKKIRGNRKEVEKKGPSGSDKISVSLSRLWTKYKMRGPGKGLSVSAKNSRVLPKMQWERTSWKTPTPQTNPNSPFAQKSLITIWRAKKGRLKTPQQPKAFFPEKAVKLKKYTRILRMMKTKNASRKKMTAKGKQEEPQLAQISSLKHLQRRTSLEPILEKMSPTRFKYYRNNSSKQESDKKRPIDRFPNKSVVYRLRQFKSSFKELKPAAKPVAKSKDKFKININMIGRLKKIGVARSPGRKKKKRPKRKLKEYSNRVRVMLRAKSKREHVLEVPRSIHSHTQRKSHFSISSNNSQRTLPATIERKSTFGVDRVFRQSYSQKLRNKMMLIKLDQLTTRCFLRGFFAELMRRMRRILAKSQVVKRKSQGCWRLIKKKFNFREKTKNMIYRWLNVYSHMKPRFSTKMKKFMFDRLPLPLKSYVYLQSQFLARDANSRLVSYFQRTILFHRVISLYQNLNVLPDSNRVSEELIRDMHFKFHSYNILSNLFCFHRRIIKTVCSRVNYKPERSFDYVIHQFQFLGKKVLRFCAFHSTSDLDYVFFLKKRFRLIFTLKFFSQYFVVEFEFDLKKKAPREEWPSRTSGVTRTRWYPVDDLKCTYSDQFRLQNMRTKAVNPKNRRREIENKIKKNPNKSSDRKKERSLSQSGLRWEQPPNKILDFLLRIQKNNNVYLKSLRVLNKKINLESFGAKISPAVNWKYLKLKKKLERHFLDYCFYGKICISEFVSECGHFFSEFFRINTIFFNKFIRFRKIIAKIRKLKRQSRKLENKKKKRETNASRRRRINVFDLNPSSLVNVSDNHFMLVHQPQKKESIEAESKPAESIVYKENAPNQNFLTVPLNEEQTSKQGAGKRSRLRRSLKRQNSRKNLQKLLKNQSLGGFLKYSVFDKTNQFQKRSQQFYQPRSRNGKAPNKTTYYLDFWLKCKNSLVNSVYGKWKVRCKIINDLTDANLHVKLYLPRKNDIFFFQLDKAGIFNLISRLNIMKRENYLKNVVRVAEEKQRIKNLGKDNGSRMARSPKLRNIFHIMRLKKIARRQKQRGGRPKLIQSQLMGLRLLLSFLNLQKLNSKSFVFTTQKANFLKNRVKLKGRNSIRKEIIKNRNRRIKCTFDHKIGENCVKLLNVK